MATPGDRIREPSGVELLFVETAEQTGGKRSCSSGRSRRGRRLVARAHRHPDGPEGWAVIAGDARYKIAGTEHEATAGDSWEVPGNTSHVHPWNVGSGPLTVRQTIDAAGIDGLALGVERYFETLMALAQRGQTDEKFDIKPPLQSALTIRELLMPGQLPCGPAHLDAGRAVRPARGARAAARPQRLDRAAARAGRLALQPLAQLLELAAHVVRPVVALAPQLLELAFQLVEPPSRSPSESTESPRPSASVFRCSASVRSCSPASRT